jgi:hypothetical protein
MAKNKGEPTIKGFDISEDTPESTRLMNADDIHTAVKARMEELRPIVGEYNQLVEVDKALDKIK